MLLVLSEIEGQPPVMFYKKGKIHRIFPLNFAKFLRTPFLQNNSGRLLLKSDQLLTLTKCNISLLGASDIVRNIVKEMLI